MSSLSQRSSLIALVLVLSASGCGPAAPPPTPTVPVRSSDASPTFAAEAKPGAAAPATAPAPAAQTDQSTATAVVRMGAISGTPDRALFVGQEKGFYAEQGIELDLQLFRNTGEMVPLFATDRLDAGHGGSYAGFFNAFQTGIDFKIVSGVSQNRPPGPGIKNGQWLIVRKDLADQLRSVPDIKGRKVAVHAVGSTGDQLLEKVLEQHGLSLRDVEVEGIPFPDQMTALGNKAIDAAMAIEPLVTLAEARGVAVPIFEVARAVPDNTNQWLFYSSDFIKNRPEVGRRFMVAYMKSLRYVEDAWLKGINRDEVVQLFIKHTPVKEPSLYDRMGNTYSETNGAIRLNVLEADQDFFFRQGLVKQKVDPRSMTDTAFADHAVQLLGRHPY
jgi:NitT/TauT family transport system substrate-binding protein